MEIPRDRYLERLMRTRFNGSVKIITGIRRCGKSYLLFNLFTDRLLKSGVKKKQIIPIALDSIENKELRDTDRLYSEITKRITGDGEYYVMIDEVQLAEGFESLVNSLARRKNIDVYITGSNSRFLSSDIITEFRGRGTEINVRPLSFSEYLSAVRCDERTAWHDYLTFGGMPESVSKDREEKIAYLKQISDTTYLRDIVERRGVKHTKALGEIFDVMSSSVGSLSNPHRMAEFLRKNDKSINDETVSKFISYFEEAYIFEESRRFDVKGNAYFDTPAKYYCTDTGLRNARIGFRQNEYTHLMENAIYNELRCRGFDVDVGIIETREYVDRKREFRQLEIDFVANKGDIRYYIQSAFRTEDDEKIEKEMRPFLKLNDGFKKIIVTGDDVPIHRTKEGIAIVNVVDFMKDTDILEKL